MEEDRVEENGEVSNRGRIVRIELDNFKSYAGRSVIGPFFNWTCVIGPNGSGKSNLMDAISFVLGVRSGILRGANLKELIYNADGQDPVVAKRRAVVRLILEGEEEGEEISFGRVIASTGAAHYEIDNKTVTWEAYDARLKTFGILTQSRNFLVFQGDVESIASKTPKELTLLIEQISGSEQYREDYEKLEKEYLESAEAINRVFAKRRGVGAEKTQYKLKKKEAERFDELTEELKETRVHQALLNISRIERDIRRAKRDLTAQQDQLAESQARQAESDANMKEKRKEASKINKDIMTLSKKLKDLHDQIANDRKPAVEKQRTELNFTKKKLAEKETALEKCKAEDAERASDIKKLEKELSNVQKQAREYEASLGAGAGIGEVSPANMAEYNRLKVEANTKTVTMRQELESVLKAQQTGDRATEQGLDQNLASLRARLEGLQARFEEARSRRQAVAAEHENLAKQLQAMNEKKQKAARTNEERERRKAAVEKELTDTRDKLRDMKADFRENEKEKRMREALDAMARLFRGVRGRMLDLVKIPNKRHNVAVTVAMGKHMDAILVDDERTARDCMQYLHEQRVGTATFLPLDTIKAKHLDERLVGELGGTAKMVYHTLQFEPAIQKAVLFAVANTVVVDSLDEAKRLAYDGRKIKVVTVDGTVINKAGTITGGLAGIEGRAHRFDSDALKKKRDQLTNELQELSAAAAASARDAGTAMDFDALASRVKLSKSEMDSADEKMRKIRDEIALVEAEIAKLVPELEKVRRSIADRERSIRDMEARISAVEEQVFSGFLRSIGAGTLKDFESKVLGATAEMTRKRQEFNTLQKRITDQLDYKRSRDMTDTVAKATEAVKALKKEVNAHEQRLAKLQAALDASTTEETGLKEKEAELKAQMEEFDTELESLKKILTEHTAAVNKAQKRVSSIENDLSQLRNRRAAILRNCRLEEIELTVVTVSQATARSATAKRRKSAAAMEVDEGQGAEEEEEGRPVAAAEQPLKFSEPISAAELEGTGGGNNGDGASQASQSSAPGPDMCIAFDSLPEELRAAALSASSSKFEEADRELSEKERNIMLEMDRIAPSVRAADRYDEVQSRYASLQDEVDKASKEQRAAKDRFEAVKKKRYEAFMRAFDPISASIDGFYKELTKTKQAPMGGQAYLAVDEIEKPFTSGIRFTVVPPNKQYRDLEQLSGGEKTVSALALLFAIHQARPSPFFVLDEIDAALDSGNVLKVATFVRARSRSTQFVVISLKDSFYERSDALVGICRDRASNSSKSYTLDLSAFAPR